MAPERILDDADGDRTVFVLRLCNMISEDLNIFIRYPPLLLRLTVMLVLLLETRKEPLLLRCNAPDTTSYSKIYRRLQYTTIDIDEIRASSLAGTAFLLKAERIRSASAQIVNSQVWTMKRQVLTKSVYYRSLINLPSCTGKTKPRVLMAGACNFSYSLRSKTEKIDRRGGGGS